MKNSDKIFLNTQNHLYNWDGSVYVLTEFILGFFFFPLTPTALKARLNIQHVF